MQGSVVRVADDDEESEEERKDDGRQPSGSVVSSSNASVNGNPISFKFPNRKDFINKQQSANMSQQVSSIIASDVKKG